MKAQRFRNYPRCRKARYDIIWNLLRLLDYIEATDFRPLYEDQLHAMSLLVIFSAARMTEFSQKQLSNINQEQEKCMVINTQIKKRNRIRNEQLNSQSLASLLRNTGTYLLYNGPSIRHASMTKLRASRASIMDVNAFYRHILASNVVDAFYYRPIQRDLGALLINIKKSAIIFYMQYILKKPKVQSQCTKAADELDTFQEITSTTSENGDNRDSEERCITTPYLVIILASTYLELTFY
ncbi:MAG: hypothetical protein EZS28_035321 [Streblomastix strix]|uniref:Uncharacterized protein n=1 Tax=Streblomastix strix TaxID=222440 RepID=A0A5J4UGX2_9EUKA|nr:MAG: hypothetical protein EZS28_035321 [Streblomastix strix]